MNEVDILGLFISGEMRIFQEFRKADNPVHWCSDFMADIGQKR